MMRLTPLSKRFLTFFALLTFLIFSVIITGCSKKDSAQKSETGEKPLKTVGITQIVSHPSLDEVRIGVIKGLLERGYKDGESVQIIFRNANGDPSLTLPIAQDFVRRKVDVIISITTPSAMGAAKSTNKIPIVFGGVTDPIGVGLVSDLNHPGKNITGTSDRWPIEEQLAFFKKLYPNLKKLGVLYKPGDDVSAFGINELKILAPIVGIELDIRPVSGPSDIFPSAAALFRDVDAVYTGMDNLIVENLESLIKAAKEANKPLFAGDEGAVRRGALATVSIKMEELGILTGKMAADILEGQNPGEMPVRIVSKGESIINIDAAKELGLDNNLLNNLDFRKVTKSLNEG